MYDFNAFTTSGSQGFRILFSVYLDKHGQGMLQIVLRGCEIKVLAMAVVETT